MHVQLLQFTYRLESLLLLYHFCVRKEETVWGGKFVSEAARAVPIADEMQHPKIFRPLVKAYFIKERVP